MPLSQKKSQRSFLSRNIYQSLGTHCSRIIFLQWYRRGNRNINLGVFYLFSFTKRESWSSQWGGLSSGSIGKSIIEYFILKRHNFICSKKKKRQQKNLSSWKVWCFHGVKPHEDAVKDLDIDIFLRTQCSVQYFTKIQSHMHAHTHTQALYICWSLISFSSWQSL